MTPRDRRNGFALAVAVCMLAAVGGLAAASFYTVVEARRRATRFVEHEQAASAADIGLYALLDSWQLGRRDSLAVGASDSEEVTGPRATGASHSRLGVTHITPALFWVVSTGEVRTGTGVAASRGYQVVLESLVPTVRPLAALTARGDVSAGLGSTIVGRDATPLGWSDCLPADTADGPSIVVPPGRTASLDDGTSVPDARIDARAADTLTYEVFGRVSAAALTARADVTLPAGAAVGPAPDLERNCRPDSDLVTPSSWGEPDRTGRAPGCERYFPVVFGLGDLTVTEGRGQGVLIVNGRLRIEGPFLFAGLIVARGGLETVGRDVRLDGAILSGSPAPVRLTAGRIQRSTCAVRRASNAAARPYVEALRGWAQAF